MPAVAMKARGGSDLNARTPTRPRNLSQLAVVLSVMTVISMQLSAATAAATMRGNADVQWYARSERVGLEEAERRLALQDDAAQLEQALETSHPTTFGGLWIQHRPDFRIVAAFTQDTSEVVTASVRGTALEGHVEQRVVTHSLRQLRADISSLEWLSTERLADLMVDVRRNLLEITTASAGDVYDALKARGVQLPAAAVLVEVPALSKPGADIYGGLALTTCTSGFGVLNNGTADRGIATASHCDDSQSYNGTSMTFQLASAGSNHDEQWHTITGYTVRNWVKDPYEIDGTRDITSRTARSSQVVGYQVCKFGKMTGWGCGYITSKDSTGCMNGGTQHIYLDAQTGVDLANGGDSGMATFRNNSAYGQMSCLAGHDGTDYRDVIYIAVDYIESGLGVTVLTSP